jgi:hypothetical protein
MPIFVFALFQNSSKALKQTGNFFLVLRKNKTEPKQIELRFVSVRTETKYGIVCFKDTLGGREGRRDRANPTERQTDTQDERGREKDNKKEREIET